MPILLIFGLSPKFSVFNRVLANACVPIVVILLKLMVSNFSQPLKANEPMLVVVIGKLISWINGQSLNDWAPIVLTLFPNLIVFNVVNPSNAPLGVATPLTISM